MAYYMMFMLEKHDAETFAEYQRVIVPTLEDYDWKVLSVNAPHKVLEGDADPDVCVLLEFPDEAEFDRWWNSPEYGEVKPLRHRSTSVVAGIGFDGKVVLGAEAE